MTPPRPWGLSPTRHLHPLPVAMMASDTDVIPPGAFVLCEVRGDGVAALDNFTLRAWPERLNAWLDNLPGYWGAKLPTVGIGNAAALVTVKAPQWSPSAAMTIGDARRMLSGVTGGVDVVRLTVTGTAPATPAQVAAAQQSAANRSPIAWLANVTENVLAWVVVGVVAAVILSRDNKR